MIKKVIFDVDGVFTTGQFLYTEKGKFAKVFGPHDNDGIKLLRQKVDILAITADRRGLAITKKRIKDDMKIPLYLIPESKRLKWFKSKFNLKECCYMGDSMHDAEIFNHVAYAIAPSNAFNLAKKKADYVTRSGGGEGAVAEACLHLLNKFFKKK